MKKQNGFTLIELVVVIIILGILAVVAAPKFINLSSDAREAALQGVAGSIKGANAMVHAKAQVAGVAEEPTANVNLNGTAFVAAAGKAVTPETFGVVYGYIPATQEALRTALELDVKEWDIAADAGVAKSAPETKADELSINIKQKDAPNGCYVTYTQAGEGVAPVVEVVETGC
ncbi:type II secretion system protein [Shewanella submarina]|uniref:Type II secretion system protein n=1 Tax=Shewanella submarina TaxID=2016376 RepID=A0ABV7GCX1_9GAMM|nr:type II secretion system protein [Shewanella submarina]